tara:strand:- start:513 stop:863 length:351 start_codon:yes stop_codon:yes gene_type:complete
MTTNQQPSPLEIQNGGGRLVMDTPKVMRLDDALEFLPQTNSAWVVPPDKKLISGLEIGEAAVWESHVCEEISNNTCKLIRRVRSIAKRKYVKGTGNYKIYRTRHVANGVIVAWRTS